MGGGGYEGMPLASSPGNMEGAKWPGIHCLNVCDHSPKAWIYVHLESVSKIDTYMSDVFSCQCVECNFWPMNATKHSKMCNMNSILMELMLTKWEVHCKMVTHHMVNRVVEL